MKFHIQDLAFCRIMHFNERKLNHDSDHCVQVGIHTLKGACNHIKSSSIRFVDILEYRLLGYKRNLKKNKG